MTPLRERGSFQAKKEKMVKALIAEGVIKSKTVEKAFAKVCREEFVWRTELDSAYFDTPLALGDTGQTISAPHMVAIMLEELKLSPGHRVLEVGCGSGYSAALMAEIVGPSGSVVSVERIPELVDFARSNLERTGYSDVVNVVLGDGSLGYPPRSDDEIYDRAVVTAAASKIPSYLKAQVKLGGVVLVPVGDRWSQTLVKLVKTSSGKFSTTDICECIFVPLIGEE